MFEKVKAFVNFENVLVFLGGMLVGGAVALLDPIFSMALALWLAFAFYVLSRPKNRS